MKIWQLIYRFPGVVILILFLSANMVDEFSYSLFSLTNDPSKHSFLSRQAFKKLIPKIIFGDMMKTCSGGKAFSLAFPTTFLSEKPCEMSL